MAGPDSKVTVEADTSGAIRSVKNLESAFGNLKSALLGLGITAAIQQANQFALSLDQASRASGVALTTVASFSKAVSNLGGDAGRAAGDVIDFVAGLDAAKQGSASAQVALQQIGITLSDLGKLGNEDLFKKTVQGIAAIGDASTRNRLAVQLLGRSFKDIDIRDVAARMNAGGGGINVAAIESGAAAQRNLSKAFGEFQNVLLQTFKPLNDFIAGVEVTAEKIRTWIGYVGVLAALIINFIPTLSFATKAFLLLSEAIGVIIGMDTLNSLKSLADTWDRFKNPPDTEKLKKAFREMENVTADKVRTEELQKQKEEQTKIVDAFRAQRLEQDKLVAGYKTSNNETLRQLDFQNKLIGLTEEDADKKTKLFELETTYIGKINEILAKNEELRKAAAVGTKEEQAAYAAYSANVQTTIGKLADQYGIQLDAATKLIDRGQGLALLEKDRQNTLERITAQMEQQARIGEALASARLKMGGEKQDLTFQRGLIGFGNLTKQRLTIVEESRKAGNEAARAYAAAFEGEDMTAAQAQQFADGLAAIEEGYAEIRDLQLSNLNASQEWSAGWREAFQNYADEAENTARQASDYFSTFTKGWEDAIVNFVRTGKLSFKDLANSMIAEFAKIQAQKMFVQLFGATGNAGTGLLGSLFSGFFGKAGGGAVNAGQSYMVGESGKEIFTPNSAGRISPMGEGSGQVNVTYNINATDAQSFRTMIARDPQFIYNVTEAGRRSQPSRRLA